jgi:hypothetical protein
VVTRSQLRQPRYLGRFNRLTNGRCQRDHELRRSVSVSGKPIEHPCISVMVVRLPGAVVCGVALPMHVDEALRVLVMRIASMPVLKWPLNEGEEQTRYDNEMSCWAHQSTILSTFVADRQSNSRS